MDAEYYQPAYLNLESQLQGVSEHLAEIADFPSESIDPRRTPEKEFHYVEIENLDELNGSITGYQNIIGSEAPSRARLLIRTGDIIIPSLRGSFKKIAIVSPQFNDCLATTGFLLVHPTHIDATGLFGVLRSKVGQMQLERAVTGAIMPALTRSELENVLIPATSKERSFSSYVDQFLSSIRDLQRVSSTIIANAKSEIQDCILGN
jgi:restriction endonuclease S subunit